MFKGVELAQGWSVTSVIFRLVSMVSSLPLSRSLPDGDFLVLKGGMKMEMEEGRQEGRNGDAGLIIGWLIEMAREGGVREGQGLYIQTPNTAPP